MEHANGIYSLMTADSVQLITSWRHEIMDYTKSYLDQWFELKDSNCGTALWLFATEKKAVQTPVLDIIANQSQVINPNMETKDTMLVNALKIGSATGRPSCIRIPLFF